MRLLLLISLAARLGAEVDLRQLADKALLDGPWTVTAGRPTLQIPVNDYYSEAPFWWPDRKDATAADIRRDGRRDGETNPNRFQANRQAFGKMSQGVLTLGMAAERWPKAGYAERGGEVVRVWFLRPATRMNPHLEYGQAVRGRNTGRGAGIIDTRDLIYAVQGIRLLETRHEFTAAEREGLRDWFRQYTRCLTTSKIGLAEKDSGNNHANWWSAQVVSDARYGGDEPMRRMVYALFRSTLAPQQIRADGSAPREESRIRSLSYSAFSLDALAVVCYYAAFDGENLLEAGNLAEARRYLTPFPLNRSSWKKQQVIPLAAADHFFRLLAGDKSSYAQLPPASDVRHLFREKAINHGTTEIRKR